MRSKDGHPEQVLLTAEDAPVSSREEFRRGWPALLAAAIGSAGGLAAVPLYSLSSFIAPLQAEFGWSGATVGGAATVLTLGIFLTGPVIGTLCDRYGVRRLTIASTILFALALASLSLIRDSVLQLYVGYAILTIAGAGTTSVAFSRVVNGWFVRARGLALGLMMTGSGFTAIIMPILLRPVILEYGWRAGFLACAAVALIPLPFAIKWMREQRLATSTQRSRPSAGIPGSQAMRSGQFWMLGTAGLIFGCAAGGFIVHLLTLLGDLGLTPGGAAKTASLLGIGLVLGRLGTGFLLDRFPAGLIGAVIMVLPAVGFTMLQFGPPSAIDATIILIGLAIGSEGDLLAFFTARQFGMRSYAALFGWIYGFLSLGTAFGPLQVALIRQVGDHRLTLTVFAIECLIAAVLLGTLGRRPRLPGLHDTPVAGAPVTMRTMPP